MVTTEVATPKDAQHPAEEAAERLRRALVLADVRLPSLRAGHGFANFPHVELGGCHADLAERLATWIEEHVDGGR
jgi:hypothetical protein